MSDANSLKIFCLSVQKQRRGGKGEEKKQKQQERELESFLHAQKQKAVAQNK